MLQKGRDVCRYPALFILTFYQDAFIINETKTKWRDESMEYILLILGFVLLIKGADFFVDGSSSVAKILKVPTIIIGLTVVAFGTSMPELSVSVNAAIKGSNDLAVSNVLGSNIFNLLVVLGCSALVRPIQTQKSILKKEFPFSIFAAVILLLLISDFSLMEIFEKNKTFSLGKIEGIFLLVLFGVFLYATVKTALAARRASSLAEEQEEYKVLSPVKSLIYIIGGLAGIVWGGDLVVDSACKIAEAFGLSQTFIGLTIVALGTSLPELVTSMVAAGKGENDLAVGNVVGSNIFNILLILGVSASIMPITVNATAVYDTIILIIVSVAAYVCAVSRKEIKRLEGGLFIAIYLAFFFYITFR